MRCLRHILGITWQDKVPNRVVLEQVGIFSMYTLLKQWHLRWLGHVVKMEDGQIPKDLLYGELVQGNLPRGRPHLQAGSEALKNGPQQMRNLDNWTFSLEAGGAAWPLPIWRDTCPAGRGKEAVPKAEKPRSWTGDRLYLSSVWKGLSLSNWPPQPH